MGEEECLVFAVSADLGVGVYDTAGVGLGIDFAVGEGVGLGNVFTQLQVTVTGLILPVK